MSKTKAAIAIVDDEFVWRAISPLSTCLAEKETSGARVVWLDDHPNDAIKEGESRSRSYHVPFTGNSRRLRLWTNAKLGDS